MIFWSSWWSTVKGHRLKMCKEIKDEYKPLLKCSMRRTEQPRDGNIKFLQEWFSYMENKWDKVKIGSNEKTPKCIKRLLEEDKFKINDVVYVQIAYKTGSILVAQEYHFTNAKSSCRDLNITDISESIIKL